MAEPLAIEERRVERRSTLVLLGELDVANAPRLEERVMEICRGDALEIVLDMSRLSFIDSSGLNALLRLKAVCAERDCGFSLMPGPPPVQRLFDVTRLRDRLPFLRGARPAPDACEVPGRARAGDPDAG